MVDGQEKGYGIEMWALMMNSWSINGIQLFHVMAPNG